MPYAARTLPQSASVLGVMWSILRRSAVTRDGLACEELLWSSRFRPLGAWALFAVLGAYGATIASAQSQALPAQSQALEDAFRRGAIAMHDGRSAEAESSFREAVKLAPDMADAHLDLGLVLDRQGKVEEAIGELRTALRQDPKIASGHMFLGVFLYQTNQTDEARRELQEEVALAPTNAEALMWLGMLELSAGHPEQAVGPLEPKNLDLLEYRGRAHREVAQESYSRMARIDPGSWHVHRVQAQMLSEDGRHTEAIAEYEAAVKLEGRNTELWEGLGDEYRIRNQLEQARTAYRKELELSPGDPIAMYNLGSTEVGLGDAAAGVPLLEAMLKIYRSSPVTEYYLGRGLAILGRNVEARALFEKSITDEPEGEAAKRSWYELTRLYRKLGRSSDAQHALAQYTAMRDVTDKKTAAERQNANWQKLGRDTSKTAEAPAASVPSTR